VNNQLDIQELVEKYSSVDIIWDKDDKWHYYVYATIKKYINRTIKKLNLNKNILILNAGSAGEEYNLTDFKHIHLDIVEKNIKHTEDYIISNIENIPLEDNYFDMIICVGSVLNYSDALQSISEFSRLLKKDGHLILEFESSKSFEYIFTEHFCKNSALVKTFYQNKEEKLWVYSEKYIKNILSLHDFIFLNEHKFHIISGLVYRITNNSNLSAKFSNIDKVLSKCKMFNKFATNIILTYQKS
jgi:ubiquinone/menaquinone biosynthesis C-methylase UbiE